jgi:hypothetical protein
LVAGVRFGVGAFKFSRKYKSLGRGLTAAGKELASEFSTDWHAIDRGSSVSWSGQLGATIDILLGTSLNNEENTNRPEAKPGSPALDGDPYSPEEVSRRQSETRRQLETGNNDPDSPLPDQGPGKNIKSELKAKPASGHEGERNVNRHEEHSRTPKGNDPGPRRQ